MEIIDLCNTEVSERPVQESAVLMRAIDDYINSERYRYQHMTIREVRDSLLSEYNYQNRAAYRSCRPFGLTIAPGDICYIDFGRAYTSEVGYQHFGLVISIFNGKAFVVPMTSNFNAYQQAYDPLFNPEGIRHLMRLGKIEGLYKYSVLFLNDAKYINMARIIEIKAHLSTASRLFADIRDRALESIAAI